MNFISTQKKDSCPEIVIVGAGLAGLAAAEILTREKREVLIIEASDSVGGRVRTDRFEGFQLDRGFQILLTAYPELSNYLDLDHLDLQYFDPGALVFYDDHLKPIGDPFRQPKLFLPTLINRSIGLHDKISLLRLRQKLIRTKATSLTRENDTEARILFDRLGFSISGINRFIAPLIGGIQLDPDLGGSGRLALLILKMLFKGRAAVPKAGMGEIPNQIASRLSEESIQLSCPVERLSGRRIFLSNGEELAPANVVIATDGPTAEQFLDIEPVGSRSVSCVYFAAPKPPTNSSAILLNGEKIGPASNVAVITNVAESYSSGNEALIVTSVPGLSDTNNFQKVKKQMRKWFGNQVNDWRHLHTYNISHGQPNFRPGDPFRQAVELGEGRFVCGDHRDTPSIQGALVSGRRTAEAILHKSSKFQG